EKVCIYPDDDPLEDGYQVMPVQGANKTILKCVIVNDSNGIGDIINVTIEKYYPDGTLKDVQELHVATEEERIQCAGFNCSIEDYSPETSELFVGYQNMTDYDPSGIYNLTVEITNQGAVASRFENISSFEYLELIGIEIEPASIQFEDLIPGDSAWIYGNDNWGDSLPTVRNTGNVPIDLDVSATNLTSGSNVIPVESLDINISGQYLPHLDLVSQRLYVNIDPFGGTGFIDYGIHVPEGTNPGSYFGDITIAAQKA
ncbi:hypothetical protein ACFLY8_06095, partial [Halobacteriota archaeon]